MELFEPGSSSPVHDFNGGIAPSGLFWTVPLPAGSVVVAPGGKTLTVDARDITLIDTFTAPSFGNVAGTVNFQMTWTGRSGRVRRGRGRMAKAGTTAAFAGRFFKKANATGTFSGSQPAFSFTSGPTTSLFAELGTEKNGVFLARCRACGGR